MPTIQTFDDPRLAELRRKTRFFIDDHVKSEGPSWERLGTTPHSVFGRLGDMGLLGHCHEEAYGGSALGPIGSVVFAEELSRSTYGGMAEAVLIHTDMSSTHIAHRGTLDQKRRYLPGMIRGDLICGIAITEPDAGSDVARLSTTATRDGTHYVLNGTKIYATNALHGDVTIVAARTHPTAKASRSISLFAVERGTPGLTVHPMAPKHGLHSSDIARLEFKNARVSAECLLGEEHAGFRSIMENFQNERLVLGAMALGMGEKALQITLEHVKSRSAFGATLWELQSTRHRLAFLMARQRAVGTLIQDTALRASRGEDCVREVSMVKALAGETVQDIMRGCLQLHGGAGYMQDAPIERLARDARILTIGGGVTEVMLDEIAKRI